MPPETVTSTAWSDPVAARIPSPSTAVPSTKTWSTTGPGRSAAPSRTSFWARRVVGDGISHVHSLPDSGQLVIGRAKEADIQIDDPSISRQHARLYLGETIQIEDAGSANGTRIAERAIAPGQQIDVACP